MEYYRKIDDYTLEVEKYIERPPERIVTIYDYDSLLKQREMVIKQRDELIALKERELAEIDELIRKCEELGIKSRESGQEMTDGFTGQETTTY